MHLVQSENGRVVSRQLCTNAFHFADILHTRIMQNAAGLDPFHWHTPIPLAQVESHIAAHNARN